MIPSSLFFLLFVVVVFLPVIFLLAPIRIKIRAEKNGLELVGWVDLTLFWGLFCFRVDFRDRFFWVYFFRARILGRRMEREDKKAGRKEKKKGFSFRVEYVKPVLSFVYSLFETFSVERFRLRLFLGLGGAYETGLVCGFLYPLLYPLNLFRNTCIQVTPCFDAPALDGWLEVDIENRFVRLIHPLFQLLSDLKLKERIVEKIKDAV